MAAKKTLSRAATQRLFQKLKPSIRRAFLDAVRDMKDSAVLKDIDAAILSGNIETLMAALNIKAEFLAPLKNAIADAYIAGGTDQIAAIPRPPSTTRLNVRFDGRHPRAELQIQEMVTKVVGVVIESERNAIRDVLERRLIENRPRRKTVIDLIGRKNAAGVRKGGLLGLGDQRTGWVDNARYEISGSTIDRNYFTRKLRDRRYDPAVRRAIASGQPLPQKTVDKIIGRYADRQLVSRGNAVADEGKAALSLGKKEAIDQLVENGPVTDEMVSKVWESTPSSEKTRPSHRALNGQIKPKDEPFISPVSGASIMQPHDPLAPTKETIRCRCTVSYRIDYLALAV